MMHTAINQIILVAAALVTIAVTAFHIDGVARVFLLAQAGYWSLCYVARPALLLWAQPQPQFGDNIADPRLAMIGYDYGITMVLKPVVFGLWFYAVLVLAYAAWARTRARTPSHRYRVDVNIVLALWLTYALGLLGRGAAYMIGTAGAAGETQSANAVLHLVALLAALGSVGLVIFFRDDRPQVTAAVLTGLITIEFLWTMAIQSKTPILGAALALAVRFAITGWSRYTVAAIGAVATFGVASFGWLQSFKVSAAASAQAEILDSSYPALARPFLSILRRFDLLEAATDSFYMDGRTWLAPTDVAKNALLSFVPRPLLGTEKLHAGVAWATDVRGSSVDMTRVSVSLAEGNINEGFVLGGYLGTAIGVSFTFVMLLAAVRALHTNNIIILVSIGLALTGLPVLYERGILGTMEVIGKTLQAAFLVWIIYLFVNECRRHIGKSQTKPRHTEFNGDFTPSVRT